jgi:hypothetical protein
VSSTHRNPYLLLAALPCAFAVGYFQAKGLNELISSHGDRRTTPVENRSQFEPAGELLRTADALLARNPFDSITGRLLPPHPPDSRTISESLGSRIHRLGPRQFIIERSAFDELNEQMSRSMNPPIVPVSKSGKVIGVRVLGVRPDTVLGALGLENGDMLQSLDGYDLTDPNASLRAAEHALHTKSLALTVTRGGGRVTLEYAIQSAAPGAGAAAEGR